MKNRAPLLMIVSSPSGAGKTTLCNRLLGEFSDLRFSTSHTTRKAWPGEIDGKHYHFVDETTFEKMVEEDRFIEWAFVHGNRYGTARSEVSGAASSKVDLIFDIDFQGARQIKAKYPDAVAVFVLPPSIEALHSRLRKRGTESPDSLDTRFKAALKEIGHHHLFEYLITNDDLNTAYDQLRAILLAERSRHLRVTSLAETLLE